MSLTITTRDADQDEFQTTRLVQAAQQGDRAAFGELVTHYQRMVYGLALRRLGNHAEAQELCQDVFVQAMCKLDQLEDARCFAGWLRSITARMAINRSMRRAPAVAAEIDMIESNCMQLDTPLGAAIDRERNAQVRVGLRRLKAADRDTLVAFYFDGRSLIEMSHRFRAPVGTIKRRLHVARKRLAKELQSLQPAADADNVSEPARVAVTSSAGCERFLASA
jgi:RNA polymerase sigma-70 factor, ECF subfamily